MGQPYSGVERRRHKRYSAAAAYWITRTQDGRRQSAWMTDLSDGGAACLVTAGRGLRTGDCVVLSGIYTADAEVAESTPAVPHIARVVRIDEPQSRICQIGLRFETEVNSDLPDSEPLRAGVAGIAPMTASARSLGGVRPSLPAIDIYPAAIGQAAT